LANSRRGKEKKGPPGRELRIQQEKREEGRREGGGGGGGGRGEVGQEKNLTYSLVKRLCIPYRVGGPAPIIEIGRGGDLGGE